MPIFPSSSSPIRFDDTRRAELSPTSGERKELSEEDSSIFDSNNSDREHKTNHKSDQSDRVIDTTDNNENNTSIKKNNFESNSLSIYDELLNESFGTKTR